MSDDTDIANGWERVPLGNVLTRIDAGKCVSCEERPAKPDEWGVLKVSAVTWTEFRQDENKVLPPDFDVPLDAEVKPGDFLISRSNTTALVGAVTLVRETRPKLMLSDKTLRLVFDESAVSPEFLELALRGPVCRKFIEENVGGASSSMKNITQVAIRQIPVPLPPLGEQRRIAGILKEQMEAVERARVAAEEQLEAAKALPAAFLRDVFNSNDAQTWPVRKLGEVSELLPAKSIATASDTEVRAVTTACLTEAGFEFDGIKTARMWQSDVELATLAPGEVLIARSNTPELVGRAARFPGADDAVVASDLTIRIWATGPMTSRFLATYLSQLFLTGYWKEKAGGASGSMKKITRKQIAGLEVPVPDDQTQNRLIETVAARTQAFNEIRASVDSQLKTINALPAALLRQAFSGQL